MTAQSPASLADRAAHSLDQPPRDQPAEAADTEPPGAGAAPHTDTDTDTASIGRTELRCTLCGLTACWTG